MPDVWRLDGHLVQSVAECHDAIDQCHKSRAGLGQADVGERSLPDMFKY